MLVKRGGEVSSMPEMRGGEEGWHGGVGIAGLLWSSVGGSVGCVGCIVSFRASRRR
jgi:hypothetical protein